MNPNQFLRTWKEIFLPVLLLLIVSIPDAKSASTGNVYITSSYDQLVTSSSLRWVSTDSSSSFSSDDPSVIRVGSSAICRGWYQNQQVTGGTLGPKGQCSVPFFEKRHFLDEFQVLVDTTSTSRIEWQRWDIFTKRPFGVVAYKDQGFVARVKSRGPTKSSNKFVLGELDPLRGLSGDISVALGDKDEVDYVTEGEILVEIEPVRYELKNTEFVKARAKTRVEFIHLGSRILVNPESETDEQETDEDDIRDNEAQNMTDEWKEITSVVAYNASYHFYWGQLNGLIRTLPSSGDTLGSHGRQEFKWGLPLDFTRHRILEVSHRLLSGTSLNISVEAKKQTSEVPYKAVLVSIFADEKTKERFIESTYRETVFIDVSMSHTDPYFTKNGSLAPTTTPTPTTTTTSTTTEAPDTTFPTRMIPLKPLRTTTPLPTSENPLLRFYPQENEVDENDDDQIGEDFLSDGTKAKKSSKHNTRSSPMSDSWTKDGASGDVPTMSPQIRVLSISLSILSWWLYAFLSQI